MCKYNICKSFDIREADLFLHPIRFVLKHILALDFSFIWRTHVSTAWNTFFSSHILRDVVHCSGTKEWHLNFFAQLLQLTLNAFVTCFRWFMVFSFSSLFVLLFKIYMCYLLWSFNKVFIMTLMNMAFLFLTHIVTKQQWIAFYSNCAYGNLSRIDLWLRAYH